MRPLLPSFEKYRLLAEISSGGMGTVYLARDERSRGLEKLIALKRIHPHLADDPQFVAMFMDEARIASLVRHANVCGVEDYGVENGSYFLTMEYLAGVTLTNVIRALVARREKEPELVKSPRFFAMAARLLSDSCEGLHAAHELTNAGGEHLGLVHRDVSPPNLFIGFDGVLRVLDFGIAKAAHRIAETTADGVRGKLAYMSPEQVKRQELDRRTDVWALGVVAYELLTQTRLFRREHDVETLDAILDRPIPLASERVPEVPPELDALVQKALSRDRDDRFATAREMGRALSVYLAECGVPTGNADVAEWIAELLPGQREKARAFVDQAQRVEATPATPPRERSEAVTAAATVPEPMARRRRSLLPIAVVALLGAAGIAAAIGFGLGPDAPPPVDAAPIDPAPADEPIAEPPPVAIAEPALDAGPPAALAAPTARRARRARRRAPAAEAPAAPAGEGTVQVVTTGGWGTVLFRGRELGTTPARFTLPAGQHTLQLRTEDGQTRSVRVTVQPGLTSRVSVPL